MNTSKNMLFGGVALSVLLAGHSGFAHAQAPDNEQLYKMLLELKDEQGRLRRENTQARNDADQARAEVARLRRRLAETEPRGKVATAPAPPPSPSPVRAATPDSRTAPFGQLQAVSTTNVSIDMAG